MKQISKSDIRPIRIGVVGLGKMGQYHINAIKSLKDGQVESYYKGDLKDILCNIELCGLCDISQDRAYAFGDIPFYNDHQKLLDEAKPDILIVATPTETHYSIAKHALLSNANVFVEKPIVTSLNQFDDLAQTAARADLKLMAGHIERYNPVSIKIRSILEKDLSKSKSFEFIRTGPHSPRITDDIITDKLIHDLDLAIFFFGDVVHYKILDKQKVDDKAYQLRLYLEHPNSCGEIFISWLAPSETTRKVSIKYDNYILQGDFLAKRLTDGQGEIDCRVSGWIESRNNQIKDELFDFIMYCYGSPPTAVQPLISSEQIRETVCLLEKIIADAEF